MDPSLPNKIALVLLGVVAAFVVLLVGAVNLWGRRVAPATGLRNLPPVHPLVALLAAYEVYLAILVVAVGDLAAFLGHPYLVGPALMAAPWLAMVVIVRLAGRPFAGDRLATRVGRRADRGDLAGAIAELQAALDRGANPGPEPASPSAPFDPWAPPASGVLADPGRAARFNLLGVLHARGNDWPAALESFRRADRVGGGEPAFRLNMGESLVMLGNPGEGLHLALGAIDAVPEHAPLRRYELNLSLARTLLDAGHGPAARDALDRAAAALGRSPILLAKHRALLAAEIEAARARLPRATVVPQPAP